LLIGRSCHACYAYKVHTTASHLKMQTSDLVRSLTCFRA
jgi:hypothetical protein